jgi:serine/threonine-protein kinase RsbW
LHLALRHDRAELERARAAVLQFVEAGSLPARAIYRIELVLEEILSNILRHGSDESSPLPVELRVALDAGGVTLTFEDHGPPFNPTEVPEPDRPDSIESARVGGWGISLVRGFADGMRYDRIDGRNALQVRIERER